MLLRSALQHHCPRPIARARLAQQQLPRRIAACRALPERPSFGLTAMADSEAAVLRANELLLAAIGAADWPAYERLCAPDLTAFEPEAAGHLVLGLPFHRYYFDFLATRDGPKPANQNTITQPHVRMLGPDAAVVSYVRLTQKLNAGGRPVTAATEETRVWQRRGGVWVNVHFHRSPAAPGA